MPTAEPSQGRSAVGPSVSLSPRQPGFGGFGPRAQATNAQVGQIDFDACGPLAARSFLEDLYLHAKGHSGVTLSDADLDRALGEDFGIPELEPLLFGLLDPAPASFTGWPSLDGLSVEDRRVVILSGVLRLSPGFTADCALKRRLASGPARTVSEIALAVNLSQSRPQTDAAMLAAPFREKQLVYEIAHALDEGLGHEEARRGTVGQEEEEGDEEDEDESPRSQPGTVEPDPVAQLLIAVAGAHEAKLGHHQKP